MKKEIAFCILFCFLPGGIMVMPSYFMFQVRQAGGRLIPGGNINGSPLVLKGKAPEVHF
jgi:hypothetical protein